MNDWMIYGANGYTGSLIAREAKRRGLTPILAGRNREACETLGAQLGLQVRVFACASSEEIAGNLAGVSLVLHCAGPFSATSRPMLEACLATKTNYLDITGEISVFENIHSQDARIREAGIVAIPGAGFDVVPTDGVAAMLKQKVPDAVKLALGFAGFTSISAGTAKTMIEGLGADGAIRRDGKIVSVPSAYKTRKIRFNKSERFAMTIPWGDVSTAFHSTGIPNIEVYMATSAGAARMAKASGLLKPLLASALAQSLLKKLAGKFISGPNEAERTTGRMSIWGEAVNAKGETLELRLSTPESYQLTVLTTLASVAKVLAGEVAPGAWTPSKAFGAEFVLSIDGVQLIEAISV
ncbi:MAG: saccharopine dehydrogenase NADP-binding domain-containing protein [Bdellovibrionota bacterium]